jgi:YegS/Rv2252/BmrU family lipid kinase
MDPKFHKIRVLANRRSGMHWSFDAVQRAFDRHWETPGITLTYQFCLSRADGTEKARTAVEDGVDLLIVVGGDGTVNSIGSALVGTDVTMGVVPVGSGNGFARHFGIPLAPARAVAALSRAVTTAIDVGYINQRPFLVTSSMAWDATLVRTFERFRVRGILPYVFAGVYEFLEYRPQALTVELDSGEKLAVRDPLVVTVANLTQYGGGAVIAPQAKPDDGQLELVLVKRDDVPFLLANLPRLLGGSVTDIPQFVFRRFRSLVVHRASAAPIQVDGELVESPADVHVELRHRALHVLVPEQITSYTSRNSTDQTV